MHADGYEGPTEILVLDEAQWDLLADSKGWTSRKAAAVALGVADTTISRAIKGETEPGAQLLKALVRAFPKAQLGQLFHIRSVDPGAVSTAGQVAV